MYLLERYKRLRQDIKEKSAIVEKLLSKISAHYEASEVLSRKSNTCAHYYDISIVSVLYPTSLEHAEPESFCDYFNEHVGCTRKDYCPMRSKNKEYVNALEELEKARKTKNNFLLGLIGIKR